MEQSAPGVELEKEGSMHRIRSLSLILAMASLSWSASATDQPGGWASMNGGTTGGTGGMEITVTNIADLQKYAKLDGKYVIWVQGTLGNAGTSGQSDGDRVVVSSDKSVLGLPGATIHGGFDLVKGVRNIILRNLRIQGPGALDVDGMDAVHLDGKVKNVWLDHLDISDGEDGNMDITHACDYITISWTRFSHTAKSFPSKTSGKSHRYSSLIGHSDNNAAEDSGHLLITFYKTWWADGVAERMPRVRFGKVHIANCLFTSTDPGQSHCIRACHKSDILAESNSFIGQNRPIDTAFDPTFTAITVRNNRFASCKGDTVGSGISFLPPYAPLAFSDPAGLQAEVGNPDTGAGATLIWPNTLVLAGPFRQKPGKGALSPATHTVEAGIVNIAGRRLTSRPPAEVPRPR
jgi:pectate lyase